MSDKFRYKESGYDERQTAVRGRAFKWAYFTLLIALLFYSVSDGIWNWCIPLTGCAIAIAISIIPFAWVSIMNDAYWWASTKRIGQYVTFALLGIMNIGLALSSWRRGDLVVDGILQVGGTNLILGTIFIYIFVIAMIRRVKLKQESDDD